MTVAETMRQGTAGLAAWLSDPRVRAKLVADCRRVRAAIVQASQSIGAIAIRWPR